jgi:hypothetical protein
MGGAGHGAGARVKAPGKPFHHEGDEKAVVIRFVEFIRLFIKELKASGLIARAVERTGTLGVSVAPPAGAKC